MKLLWLDLETTGLDPRQCAILELAATVSDCKYPYHHGQPWTWTLRHDGRGLTACIRDMHTCSGLLSECLASDFSVERVEDELLRLLPDDPTMTLAGASVHFDLGFVRVHMPRLAARLSHRVFDTSAIKLFCQSLGMGELPRNEAHRAADDVFESIEHARQCALKMEELTNMEHRFFVAPAYTPAQRGVDLATVEALIEESEDRIHEWVKALRR